MEVAAGVAVAVVHISMTRKNLKEERGSRNQESKPLAITRRTLMWWRDQNRNSPYQRWLRPKISLTPMFWALVLWLCALPLLALLAAPFLGWKVAAFLAGALLVADLVICAYICRVRLPKEPPICAKCLKRLYAQVQHRRAPEGEYQKKIV